jgi:NAD(P)-dependent dehydrogenase (short-subunit alcohol dehydrogenase family)
VDGKVYEVQFDDWMYLMDERVMLNKAVMSKFGIRLGEVTLSFYKPRTSDMPLNPRIDRLAGPRGLAGRRLHRHRPRHGRAPARRWARGVVSARSAAARRLRAVHPAARPSPLDATDRDAMRAAAAQHRRHARPHRPGHVLRRHYKPMRATAFDLDDALRHVQVNYVGALYLLDAVLPHCCAPAGRPPQPGVSVAGYRGLPQALAYGPTKAALINLAETLYLDLHRWASGVSVVNPGFVETPLTAQNDFKMPALITPEEAAARSCAAGARRLRDPLSQALHAVAQGLRLLGLRAYFAAVRRSTGL